MKWLLFSFEGGLNRQPYWIVVLILGLLNGGLQSYFYGPGLGMAGEGGGEFVAAALAVLCLRIGLAVNVKRWHDRDKTGWWVLIGFIPLVGWLWVLIECGFLRGTWGGNRYGPDPLAAGP